MNKFLADIEEFHVKFNQAYDGPPRTLEGALADFRSKFISEEHQELLTAWLNGDTVGSLDAFVDLAYVLFGTVYLAGMLKKYEEAWDRVHSANMQKELASTLNPSKRGHDAFDIVKPTGWTPPDLSDLVGE